MSPSQGPLAENQLGLLKSTKSVGNITTTKSLQKSRKQFASRRIRSLEKEGRQLSGQASKQFFFYLFVNLIIVAYLNFYVFQVIPCMMTVIRASDKNFQDFLFLQLASLIGIVKQHIRNYLDDIFEMIKEFWTPDSPLQSTIILLGMF